MEKSTRVCAWCGAAFESSHPRAICCSRECGQLRNRKRQNAKKYVTHEPATCPGCGVIFTPRRSDSTHCTTLCKQRDMYVPAVERNAPRSCEHCGEVFIPQRADKRFCSDLCQQRKRKDVPLTRDCIRCGVDISNTAPRIKYCEGCKAVRVREHYDQQNARARAHTKPPRVAVCAACGTEFSTRHSHAKFCSKACGEWTTRHPGVPRDLSRICVTCGAAFIGGTMAAKHCSLRCSSAASKRRTREIRTAYRPVVTCAACGKELPRGKRAGSKYCNIRCSRAYYVAPHRFADRFGRTCERCGVSIPDTERLNKRFCTSNCQVMFNQEMRRVRKRGLPVERISRAAIFERDNMVCHLCGGDITDKPVLDHIIPIARPDCPGHVWENVAAAHAFCNHSKRDRVKKSDYDLYERLLKERQAGR